VQFAQVRPLEDGRDEGWKKRERNYTQNNAGGEHSLSPYSSKFDKYNKIEFIATNHLSLSNLRRLG